jgi:DNA-binding transcriptional regulator YiaG
LWITTKKEFWPERGKGKMSLEKRQLIQAEVKEMRQKTGIGISVLAGWAGIPRSTWQEWQGRKGEEPKHCQQVKE